MRPHTFAVFFLCLVSSPGTVAAQMFGDTLSAVTGSGEAEMTVPPDRVTIYFDVEAMGSTSAEAATRLDSLAGEIARSAPDQLGAHAILVGYRTGPNPQMATYTAGTRVATAVDQTAVAAYRIDLSDPKRIALAHAVLSQAGARQITSVSFSHSGRAEIERLLTIEATRDARAEAESIADGLGMSLGRPLGFTQTQHYPQVVHQGYSGNMLSAQVQDIRVQVQVLGRWRLVKADDSARESETPLGRGRDPS